jgi:hypothetical protein
MKKPFAKAYVCLIAVLGAFGPAGAAVDPSGAQIIRDSGVSAGLAAPPIYDRLAVAHGRVYLATEDGQLICCGE